MMNDVLRAVIAENSDTGGLRIVNSGETSYLALGDTVISEKTKSADRPLHCSELDKWLRRRNWHKFDTKFIASDGNLYSRMYASIPPTDTTDNIQTDVDEMRDDYAFRCSDSGINSLGLTKEEIGKYEEKINYLYNKIFGAMKETEISIYSVPKKVINIIDGSVAFDLIRYDSSEYTDTVSLGEISKLPLAPDSYGRVDLGIQYSKAEDDSSFRIYNCDTTLTAFSFVDGKLTVNNLVGKVNNEVSYELLNNVIKVSPLTNDVNECIISYCTITYGRN